MSNNKEQTHTNSEELREQLDKIFTKLKLVNIDEDGNNVYEESQPFNRQLDEAVALFTTHLKQAELHGRMDELSQLPISGFINMDGLRFDVVPKAIIDQRIEKLKSMEGEV